jgi:hypothetical protein
MKEYQDRSYRITKMRARLRKTIPKDGMHIRNHNRLDCIDHKVKKKNFLN